MIIARYKAVTVAELRKILDEIVGEDDPTTFYVIGAEAMHSNCNPNDGGVGVTVRENVLSDQSKTYDIELL